MFDKIILYLTNIFAYLLYMLRSIISAIPGSFDFWIAMFAVFVVYKMILQPFFGSAGSDRARKSGKSKGKDGG